MGATAILLTKDVHIWLMARILNNQQKKNCFDSETTKLGHIVFLLMLPEAAMSHYSFEAYVLHSFFSSSLLISLA